MNTPLEFPWRDIARTQDLTERARRELARDIVSAAAIRGEFTLASGATSDYFFEKYLFQTRPTILRRLATALAERIPASTDRLAGAALGAVAITAAASLETGLPFVIVRNPKSHDGQDTQFAGEIHRNERVSVIEDVVSSGTSAAATAHAVKRVGAEVAGVLAVIDRDEGGADRLGEAGFHYEFLFGVDDL